MPLRNGTPISWAPHGCSDAIDGGSAFKGAMRSLINLVPSPATNDQFVPRPARDYLVNLIAVGFSQSPTTITNIVIFADVIFGLIASLRNPGRDEPFAVTRTGRVLTVNGVSLDNSPVTPPALGATQPMLSTTATRRVIVTHPGFPGGIYNPTGIAITINANVHLGSPIIDGYIPQIGNVHPGQLVTGAFIPASAYVISTDPIAVQTLATGTTGSATFTVFDPSGIVPGLIVNGQGIGAGQVLSVAANVVTYSGTLTADITDSVAVFTGSRIVMSQNATADVVNEPISIASAGDPTVKVGWFDVTGTNVNVSANAEAGSPLLSVSIIAELSPGQFVSGTGIPSGARIKAIFNPTITNAPGNINAGAFNLFITVPFLPTQDPLSVLPAVGASVTGPGILPAATVVTSTVVSFGPTQANLQVTLSIAADPSSNHVGFYNIGGLYTIELDTNATVTAPVNITITGGSLDEPLWCGGDLQVFGLPSTPIGVGQLNGRAYYACGLDGLVFSDPLSPLIRTNASQALIPGNGLAVTACVGQPLNTPITGGIIASLYAFQGVSAIQQITGDPTTGNLTMNALNIESGTLAPASIIPTTLGMAFISPEGMRIIGFDGSVSQPIGEAGSGITVPFINALDITRVVAGANGNTIRVALQNAQQIGQPWIEWWYDLARKIWTGPHTLQTKAIAPLGSSFVTAAQDVPAQLYNSPSQYSGFVDHEEDGATLTWSAETILLPDTEAMAQNAVNQSTIGLLIPTDEATIIEAFDEYEKLLDSVVIPGPYDMPHYGDLPVFGSGQFYAVTSFYRQRRIAWHREINFKQASFRVRGTSRFGMAVGGLRLKYQILGYVLEDSGDTALDISVPALPGNTQALLAASTAPPGQPIGAVLVRPAHQTVVAVPASLTLTFNQQDRFALAPYSSSGVTGDVVTVPTPPLAPPSGGMTTLITNLSANVFALGWLPGHIISDIEGVLLPGTFITSVLSQQPVPSGPIVYSVTLSQPPRYATSGVPLTVTGTNLVTNWTPPIPVSNPIGQIQAVYQGYLTSYFPFLVTVPDQSYFRITMAFEIRETEQTDLRIYTP